MHFPKLTPLQSRFLASLVASAVLVILYLSLTRPNIAYAIELESRIHSDHNHPIVLDDALLDEDDEEAEHSYSNLWGRAAAGSTALPNNHWRGLNLVAGETQNYVFPSEAVLGPHGTTGPGLPYDNTTKRGIEDNLLELRKRQNGNTVYITLATCTQPTANGSQTGDAAIPPQLEIYITTSQSDQSPGPSSTGPSVQTVTASGGYASATVEASGDVYIGVSAPNTTTFDGIWFYQLAASIDAPFHQANKTWPNLFFVDSDDHAALLITNDTTQSLSNSSNFKDWITLPPPYGMFAHSMADPAILGVQNSYCGLKSYAEVQANVPGVEADQNVAGMTSRGQGGKPKEQFYLNGLNATTQYYGFLGMYGNSTDEGAGVVGGGGKVWQVMNFTTKTDNNCALMYNLSFCSDVAYAVPTNPFKFSPTNGLPSLAALYDSNAAGMYQFFNYSLQQIACNTTSSAQFSLARTCDDCAAAYKQWLCAVTIPRCEDFSNPAPWLMPRNTAQAFVNGSAVPAELDGMSMQSLLGAVATNSSRNPIIDTDIEPGPYKEVLPCEDLCYDLVQSCPAALGFGCPYKGKGLYQSYGTRSNDSGIIKCSYLGAAYYLSGADRVQRVSIGLVGGVAAFMGLVLLL